jgi:hypothetical protein
VKGTLPGVGCNNARRPWNQIRYRGLYDNFQVLRRPARLNAAKALPQQFWIGDKFTRRLRTSLPNARHDDGELPRS